MVYNNARYWIWLTLALGYRTPKAAKVRDFSIGIAEFYECGESQWKLCPGITVSDIQKLKNTKLESADKIINRCAELGVDIITFDDDRYPNCLRRIYAAPCVIYIKGLFPDFDSRFTVGIVGTRNASKYGLRVAYDAASNLTRSGVLIISGGALGIDSAAHRGALAAGGDTVCVLGVGIDVNYISQNEKMRDYIAGHGCLVTEYAPGTKAKPYHFPERNRIIAAFSDAVLVVEAAKRSGALITANLAQEQGKDVFAVMGNINSDYSQGTNALIKDGAYPYTHYTDIIDAFPNLYVTRRNDVRATEAALETIPVKGAAAKNTGNSTEDNRKAASARANHKENKNMPEADKKTGCIQDKKEETQRESKEIQGFDFQNKNNNNKSEDSKKAELDKLLEELDSEARRVYDAIKEGETVTVDELCIRLGLLPQKVLPFMTDLEIAGLVINAGARNYRKPE